MRNFLLASTVALYAAGLGGAAGQSSSDGKNRWMMVSIASGFEADQIRIIPSKMRFIPSEKMSIILSKNECCWSRNLLESIVLGRDKDNRKDNKKNNKNELFVNFDDGSQECEFDIHVTGSRGTDRYDWFLTNMDVCDACKEGKFITKDKEDICKQGEPTIVLQPPPERQTGKVVNVLNKSRLTALQAFAIPSRKECCWSGDLFGPSVVRPGDKSGDIKLLPRPTIKLPLDIPSIRKLQHSEDKSFEYKIEKAYGIKLDEASTEPCLFDIRVVAAAEPREWNFYNIDVCHPQGQRDAAELITLTLKVRGFRVKNESKKAARHVYATRSGTAIKSKDLLDGKIILPEKAADVDVLEDDRAEKCMFDIEVHSAEEPLGQWQFKDVDVCGKETPTVTLN
jgi:hypothetical protein